MTQGKGTVQYRPYKEKIEYTYQILKLLSIKSLNHAKLKSYTENSNHESFKRHLSPLVSQEYIRKNDKLDYELTIKGSKFLEKLEGISSNMVELNLHGFTDTFMTEFLEWQTLKRKGGTGEQKEQ